MPAVAFVTLGCAKNEVDTDKMHARLSAAGFPIVDDPNDAQLVIVNTCAFLMSAVDEGLEVIFDLVNAQSERAVPAKVLVAGCMPARYGDELSEELTEVAGFVSAADEEHIVEQACKALGIDAMRQEEPATFRSAGDGKPWAYVKISDGCDRFCSYCMIPYIRGRYHSFAVADILAEVDQLVSGGVREIVFIGQDTGLWGHDLEGGQTIDQLLDAAATRYPDTWFRLLYLQPQGISDALLDCMARHDNICSYLDMPLQHADADVLKRMNRNGSSESYLDELARIRSRVPGIACRTTFMAGFPGETEDQFENLLDFADEARFDYSVVFAYSQEEGSAAAKFADQVPEEVKMERSQRLLDACEVIGTASMATRVGAEADVLIEGYELTDVGIEALGRTQAQAPEVDGQVHIPIASEGELPVGSIVRVRLTDSFFYEFEGELV